MDAESSKAVVPLSSAFQGVSAERDNAARVVQDPIG